MTSLNLKLRHCRPSKPQNVRIMPCRLLALKLSARQSRHLSSRMQKPRGAIVCSGHESARIGKSIIDKGGSAVDAAIAATICEGVVLPMCCGLGGGAFLTIYQKSTGKIRTLNARETAPSKATKDMYVGRPTTAISGGLSVGIPGELKGFGEAHKNFGRLEWKELVQPSIEICRRGHLVTKFLERAFKCKEALIRSNCLLKETFIDSKTRQVYHRGQCLKRESLADTLEVIAEEGPDALYNGSLTEHFVKDIQTLGGIITTEDLRNYRAEWSESPSTELPGNLSFHTFPPPSSGVVLIFVLNLLKEFLDDGDPDSLDNMHRIIEGFKFGYAARSELGDPNFCDGATTLNLTSVDFALETRRKIINDVTSNDPTYYGARASLLEDHGTNNVCVLAPNGDAVVVTSSINLPFGAGIVSESTSIILNNQMDDFATPGVRNTYGFLPSPANCIAPGKRPLSSMSPSVVIDEKGDVRMLIGGAGGSRIITSMLLVILKHLRFGYPLEEAIGAVRYHHQLFPMSVEFESGFDREKIEGLGKMGHRYTFDRLSDGFAALTAIAVGEDGGVEVVSDRRRGGSREFLF